MAARLSNCFQRTLPPRARYPASMASERMEREPLMMWYSRLKSNGVFFSAAHCHAMSLPCSTLVHPSMPLEAIHSPIFSMAVIGSWILLYISEDESEGCVVVAIAFMGFVAVAFLRLRRSGHGSCAWWPSWPVAYLPGSSDERSRDESREPLRSL